MKKLIATYSHKISGLALFEDRRFEKASGERYLFIDTNYLYLHFSQLLNKSKFILKPTSLTEEFGSEYIEIFELETHLTIDEYNFILFELFHF